MDEWEINTENIFIEIEKEKENTKSHIGCASTTCVVYIDLLIW